VSFCSSVLEFVEGQQDKGNIEMEPVKKKHSNCASADSSDSSSSVSEISPSVFCGNNVSEVVKLLKAATEPLHQLIEEAEQELSTDSQLANSSRSQQKYERLASNLKTQYGKSVRALSAVKRTKLQTNVKNCSIDVDQTNLLETTPKPVTGHSVAEDPSSSQTANITNNSIRASRADIEAQRDLHQQMFSTQDLLSASGSSESSTSSSEDEEEENSDDDDDDDDDDDEYDPKKEIRQVKLERGRERRTNMKKQKLRASKLCTC